MFEFPGFQGDEFQRFSVCMSKLVVSVSHMYLKAFSQCTVCDAENTIGNDLYTTDPLQTWGAYCKIKKQCIAFKMKLQY